VTRALPGAPGSLAAPTASSEPFSPELAVKSFHGLHQLLIALVLGMATADGALAAGASGPAMVIDAGATVSVATGTQFTLPLNLTNNGTFTPALGSGITITGTGSPVLQGVTTFADLTINLTGTATLGNAASVQGVLTLVSGNLSLNGHDLLVSGILGGSASSYVVTPDTLGRLAQSITQYAPILFPVGNSTYDPVTIQPAVGTDRAWVAVMDAPPLTGLIPSAAMGRAWLVRQLNAPGVDGDLMLGLGWNNGEQGVNFDRSLGQPTSALAYRWLGGTWVVQPGVRTSVNGSATNPPLDTLRTQAMGLWTMASPGVLGVDTPGMGEPPHGLELAQNSPNPCVRAATIRFGLPQQASVTLAVYTVLGERVATLAQGEQAAGWHTATFDPGRLRGGIYFYRLDALGRTLSRKLIVVR
jgi:hypothetical protein